MLSRKFFFASVGRRDYAPPHNRNSFVMEERIRVMSSLVLFLAIAAFAVALPGPLGVAYGGIGKWQVVSSDGRWQVLASQGTPISN